MSGMVAPSYNPEPSSGSRCTRVLRIVGAGAVLGGGVWWAVVLLGGRGFAFATVVNGLIAVAAGLIDSAIPWRLPAGYLQLRSWERDGRWYRHLGVPLFGAFVRHTPLRALTPEAYLRGRPGRIQTVLAVSAHAEAVHIWVFLLALPVACYAVARGGWAAAGWLLGMNAALNLYPVMQQRMIRGRLERVLGRRRVTSPRPA
jgi:hypothetical protein